MPTPLLRLIAPLLLALPALLQAAPTSVVKTDQVQAELVAHAPDGVAPGKTVMLGLVIQHQPHWHTYWKNAGDSGLPTTLDWQLPAGVTAGAIEWPTPQRLPVGPLVNYGFENTLLLAVPVTVAPDFKGPDFDVALMANWLVCKEICIPESGEFKLRIPVEAATAGNAALFEKTRTTLPQPAPAAKTQARIDGDAVALEVQGLPASLQGKPVAFFAEDAGVIDHAAVPQQQWAGDKLTMRVPLSAQRSESPATMHAVLTVPGQAAGVELAIPVSGWPAVAVGAAVAAPALGDASVTPPPATSTDGLFAALAFAFLGGLLLNLMPCVFPVLSLKLLGFAQHGGERRRLVAGGLAYTLGVVVSFVALAALLLALRGAGEQLGWGFQLQSPLVVAALALLFTLIGLNLAGVFEFGGVLPGNLAASRARHPLVDDALTGVLAVAIASPCTAPFMGAALGAALTQPTPAALAIFAALGLGMASPYLAASLWPGVARLLPRPGVWMLRFKVLMAFPMFATVVWLVWVLGQQQGIDGAAALLGLLVAVAFAAWAWGSPGFSRLARRGFGAVALVVLALACAWAWPALKAGPEAAAVSAGAAAGSHWQAWSPEAVAQARQQGRPVFVDFTAAWCVSCQFNKRTTLANAELLADFEARKVLLLRADWTKRDPVITQALTGFGRSGVPVYAMYAPSSDAPPKLLSELPSVAEVRNAMAAW
ncbi:MAG TPA: thioredoxin family protein [Ideonella sp.]|nr:thioredoxin family protein [Ideonella sp.]